MRKFSLNDAVSTYYDKVDMTTIELKSGFLGICTEIDRYFKLALKLDLNKPVSEYHSPKFLEIFPNLFDMTHSQLEELRVLFCEIRNINAHLFLNHPIVISTSLTDYFVSVAKPQFSIVSGKELTMYGMLYILTFISQKYQLWPFLTECLKNKYFSDFTKKETSKMQTSTQHFLQDFCGTGKPIFLNENINKTHLLFLNDTCKRYMTKIFFALEKSIMGWSLSSTNVPPFSYLIKRNEPFSKESEIADNLIQLRNCWFHGTAIFDETYSSIFSLKFVLSILLQTKKILLNNVKYQSVVLLMEEFGEKLLHYYALRIVEVSYKLLDKRLLTEDKVDSRITDINRAVVNLEQSQINFFDMAAELINKDEISYPIGASKFLDFIPRTTKTKLLQILKIKSNDYISIGKYQTNHNEVCLALIDLEDECLNFVNGISPFDLRGKTENFYSSKICIKTINLD